MRRDIEVRMQHHLRFEMPDSIAIADFCIRAENGKNVMVRSELTIDGIFDTDGRTGDGEARIRHLNGEFVELVSIGTAEEARGVECIAMKLIRLLGAQ